MQTRELGTSGIAVSIVGIGGNNFGGRTDLVTTARIIDTALELGVDFIDTADMYGGHFGASEEVLGEVLQGRRNKFVLGTKFGLNPGTRNLRPVLADPAYVVSAFEASLRRLKTDTIDLYQLHFPSETVPILDTLDALDKLVRAGKVRAIGCSNLSAAQLAEAAGVADANDLAPFVTNQCEYSLIWREPEADILPAMARLGISFLPYFPLASGLLSGKYQRGAPPPPNSRGAKMPALMSKYETPENLDLIDRLTTFAAERGHTLLDLAIAWLLADPRIASVIAGVSNGEQLTANVAAGGWQLSAQDRASLNTLLEPA
ncbi:MAG: aldo/keto reductase [Sphingomonadales bacterium]|nr:aldo/keto reductase [Sphingomonadales bacterium]MBU3990983.1 aldo/keto reductase [Alphaproteobacteria bacterium]